MATKYVQKELPSVRTEPYKNLKVSELRQIAKDLYKKYCHEKVVVNKHIGISIHIGSVGGRKTIYGEALYSKKVALLRVIPVLLKNAKYNNFGSRKPSEPKEIIGYYNFKAYALIDEKKVCIRLAVRACKNGTFYYNVEVNK